MRSISPAPLKRRLPATRYSLPATGYSLPATRHLRMPKVASGVDSLVRCASAERARTVTLDSFLQWRRGMKSTQGIDLTNVQAVYSGAEGDLWELVMGQQIHIGGFQSSLDLAEKAGQ